MNQYRKLDDSITMRYNRATAQFRDLDRLGVGKGSVQDQACTHLWKDLVGMWLLPYDYYSLNLIHEENWKRRTEIIDYCVRVVDQSMSEKKDTLATGDVDPSTQRKIQGALYAEEVKVSAENTAS